MWCETEEGAVLFASIMFLFAGGSCTDQTVAV